MGLGSTLAEKGLLPDGIIRAGIRNMLRARLREEAMRRQSGAAEAFLKSLRHSPIAISTDDANAQHYELPADYFTRVLGPRMKYSCCQYGANEALALAEENMLALSALRAGVEDGMSILDLGCGWGSFSLWLAERFPSASITGVSNSNGQREFIEARCRERQIKNVRIITADINAFEPGGQFDRIVSVEMLEHVRNHAELFRRMSRWLLPNGAAFVHVFCHREYAYPYETAGDDNWMGRHFFTGGMMPSFDLFQHYDDALRIDARWQVLGTHYERTCRDWLARHDQAKAEIVPLFAQTYGEANAERWFHRWRLFYLACAELFAYDGGREWFVAHYLLKHV